MNYNAIHVLCTVYTHNKGTIKDTFTFQTSVFTVQSKPSYGVLFGVSQHMSVQSVHKL